MENAQPLTQRNRPCPERREQVPSAVHEGTEGAGSLDAHFQDMVPPNPHLLKLSGSECLSLQEL